MAWPLRIPLQAYNGLMRGSWTLNVEGRGKPPTQSGAENPVEGPSRASRGLFCGGLCRVGLLRNLLPGFQFALAGKVDKAGRCSAEKIRYLFLAIFRTFSRRNSFCFILYLESGSVNFPDWFW